ncbi:hypothetical protein DSC_03920 [Pseudoxanthomonas spadix BD-a59]|uniref:OmpR/PhoB-type domain-containing protein n=1 Tax=Pseudoxanthomonas spadix (strain BD-a59) TaxID=1045855 RepID=G7UNT6_PSEUP|nr:hypothetical protein DSC_03920 [Pseudoxanthomonas spadix BD-a59]
MRASPAAVTRRQLEHTLWGDDLPDGDLLRSQMSSLRRSIGFYPDLLQFLGGGIRLQSRVSGLVKGSHWIRRL